MADFFVPELNSSETIPDEKTKKEVEMYLTGENHDCIFQISEEREEPSKCFKCHKAILMRESGMLHTILTSLSNEIEVTFQIQSEISTAAFDLCMKFIYGGFKDFKTIQLACEVYLFAYKWHFNRLEIEAANFLSAAPADDLLKVFNLYLGLKSKKRMDALSKAIEAKICSIVAAESWFSAPVAVLEQIFKLPKLRMREVDLYKALVRWCRVHRHDESEMRKEVDNVVRLVRFRCMNRFEFTENCIACTSLLTRDEKYQIILRSNLNFTKLFLPQGFAPELFPRNLSEQRETFSWSDNNSIDGFVGARRMTNVMSFQVKEGGACHLSGLNLSCQDYIQPGQGLRLQISVFGNINCDVLLYTAAAVARAKTGDATVTLKYPVPLHGRHFYAIKIEYFIATPVPCKVFMMAPLDLSKHHDDVFLKLIRNDANITDICSLELRREFTTDE